MEELTKLANLTINDDFILDNFSPKILNLTGHKTMKSFMKYIKAGAEETAEKLKDHPYFK